MLKNHSIDDFCRTCLIFFNEKVGKYSLLKNCAITSAPGRLALVKKIMQTFSLSLIPDEDIQESQISICKNCVIEMNNMLNFLEKCLQSDATLKQALYYQKEDNADCSQNSPNINYLYETKPETKAEEPSEGETNKLFRSADGPLSIYRSPKKSILKKPKKVVHECRQCNKKFDSALSLTFHKYKHEDYNPHVCGICNKTFKSLRLIETHMSKEHKDMLYKPYKCRQCFAVFSDKQHLKRHESLRHNAKLYSCYSCKRTFSTISSLKYHENVHVKSGSFFCAICSKKFINLSQLKEHKRHMHFKTYKCDCCGKRFSKKKKLDLHLKSSHDKKEKIRSYSCNDCDKKFLHPYSLKNHNNTHMVGVKPYLCNICGSSFSALSNLTSHFRRAHTEKQPVAKMYLCHNCGNSFSRASHLKRHTLRKHVPNIEKKYECPICKKKFLEKSDMKGHVKLHDDIKPFPCDQCSKCFRTSWRLQSHTNRVHLNLRPFECPTCNVKFKTKSHLEKHIRTHTGEKPYPCPHCAYSCAEKSNLKKHINVHLKSI